MTNPVLMPLPKQQFFGIGAAPLVGGKVWTYAAGTTDLKDTYTDAAGTTKQPNPIPLNARGEPASPIYWDGAYKVEVRDILGNLIYTVDNYNTDPAGLLRLLTSIGSSLVGFIQAGVGAIARSIQDKLRESVHISDFLPLGFNTATGDCRTYIQAALDSRPDGLVVRGAGKAYRTTGSVYIRGNRKRLDFEGGQLILDTTLDNQQAVVIDNATAVPTVFQALANVMISASASTQARASCTGVAMNGGVLHPEMENVHIQGFGRTSGSGIGVAIYGGPHGGDDTPYYGKFKSLKVQFCATGLVVGSNPAYPRITSHTFDNLTVGGCTVMGVLLSYAEFITLNTPHLEQNVGSNLRMEGCGTNFVFGGFHENSAGTRIEVVNQDPARSNMILADLYASEPAGTGTRVSTYDQNPAICLQGNTILMERVGGQQVIFGTDDTMELKFAGIVTVQIDQHSFARLQISNGAVDLIETGGTSPLMFSTTQDTAGKVNVYASGGKYYVQNKTGGGSGMRFFTQVGFA